MGTLCGESDKNDSISGQQFRVLRNVHACIEEYLAIYVCMHACKYTVINVTVGSMLIALKLQDNRLSTWTSLSFV